MVRMGRREGLAREEGEEVDFCDMSCCERRVCGGGGLLVVDWVRGRVKWSRCCCWSGSGSWRGNGMRDK